MVIHIALFAWKDDVSEETIEKSLADVRALKDKVKGIIDIHTGKNFSKWSEGYTHAVVVVARDQSVLDAYRNHPDHVLVAKKIEKMESKSLGVDFKTE
jgi:hypothetical protein